MKLEDILTIHLSAFIKKEDVKTTISLEWFEQNRKEVELIGYKLILFSKKNEKEELFFQDREEMIKKAQELLEGLKSLKK